MHIEHNFRPKIKSTRKTEYQKLFVRRESWNDLTYAGVNKFGPKTEEPGRYIADEWALLFNRVLEVNDNVLYCSQIELNWW